MDFALELATFPTLVHRNIYAAARRVTPLDRSLRDMADGEMKESGRAFHAFLMDLFSDMYEDPAAYGLPAGLLEEFLHGRKLNGARRQEPAKTERLRSQTVNAVYGYQSLLYLLARGGEVQGGRLKLSPGVLEDAARRTGTASSPIPLDVRLSGLARAGLVLEGDEMVSLRHPGMFPAMHALSGASEKMSSSGFFAFQNLEFRNIAAPYKPVYEDYVNPLTASRRAAADRIDACARDLGMRPACNTFWKVDYKYKGVQALCLENATGDLAIRVSETYSWDDPGLINTRLAKQSPEFQRHILRHLWGCTGCSASHLGAFVTILGHKRRVCMGGGIGLRWTNPGPEDLPFIFECLKMRREIIGELKTK